MHLRILITTTLVCQLVHAHNDVPHQINVNPHFHLTISADNIMRSILSTDHTQSTHTDSLLTVPNMFKDVRDKTKEAGISSFNWICDNKLKSATAVAVTGYGYIWYKLLKLNYALSQSTRWSKWRDTLSLEELLKKPQEEIATDLLTTIQHRYTTADHIDNVIAPLISFVHDVDTEIEQLKELIKLHTWINRLYIGFLFPKQTELCAHAQESINRLGYLKNVVLTWVSNQKVAQLTTGLAFVA